MNPFTLYRLILLLFIFNVNNLYAVKPAATEPVNVETITSLPDTKELKESPKKLKRKSKLIEKFKKKFGHLFTDNDASLSKDIETRPLGIATASLVLGIIGLITAFIGFGLILSLLALIFGAIAKRKIKNSGGFYTGKGMANAGFILGLIPLAAFLLVLVIVLSFGGF